MDLDPRAAQLAMMSARSYDFWIEQLPAIDELVVLGISEDMLIESAAQGFLPTTVVELIKSLPKE